MKRIFGMLQEASNLCVKTLIFGSFSFIAFLSSVFPPLFTFLFSVYCLFSFFDLVFITLCFPPSFSLLFYPFFLTHVVLFLAYPNLLETKMIVCCWDEGVASTRLQRRNLTY
jgi:hypothetical protein